VRSLYSSPLRVYVCLALLALFGILSGMNLPISMFPNSSKPMVGIEIPLASLTPDEFAKVYGSLIEARLHSLSDKETKVESIETEYRGASARFRITFQWGAEDKKALKDVQNSIYGISGQFPKEMRDRMEIWSQSENAGFLALSFYSEKRSLDQLYDLVEPTLTPRLAQVQGTEQAVVFNPTQKEVHVELNPAAMAALQVLPKDVSSAIEMAVSAQNGGFLTVNTNNLRIQMPRQAFSIEDLRRLPVVSHTGRALHLQDVARVELMPSAQNMQSFKTSGAPSLILFATPAPGGNIKKMAEDVLAIVNTVKTGWPEDVQTRVLVDPSEFIRNSVNNVFHEVVIAAALAVLILFLFVGSLKNVATAAIEIPMSIVLAFILMRLTGININLISLGGLALSAGMNVDASVVVMENIFRHFEMHKGGALSYKQRLDIVVEAVNEVKLPVIASTVASIVVFLPLAFTSALSYAILGDLAKTVVFSHGFSAVVALILVPTIRMQLMSGGSTKTPHSPIEPMFRKLESWYVSGLAAFLARAKLQLAVYGGLILTLILLVTLVLPRLPKEIIGMPDTDWLLVMMNTQGNSVLRQMEEQSAEVEAGMLKKFGSQVSYTFTQMNGANRGMIMARLKNKKQMQDTWKQFQEHFQNTPFMQFTVVPWNPSEMPIPNPPHFQLSVLGGLPRERLEVAHQIDELIQSKKLFGRTSLKPAYDKSEELVIKPHLEQWANMMALGTNLVPLDLADISRIATKGRPVSQWVLGTKVYDVSLYYPEGTVRTPEDLAAFPIGVKNKIIPMKALADVATQEGDPPRFRRNQMDVVWVQASQNESDKSKINSSVTAATQLVRDWEKENKAKNPAVSVQVDDAQYELNDALHQLALAVALSVLLIFVTMVIQLGDLVSSLLVLIAVPLGFIGVLISLFVFRSTLSLNSALGVILLNGISVANSIILVDFFNKLVAAGKPVTEAALEAAHARLRPILMTSLCTAIGMLPIALGLGEGGRVLQPLGIAVSGGLWFSMLFTLFVVPALQVSYWRWRINRRKVRPHAVEQFAGTVH
jgi:HAE1 family hydrophobic/amphiphilic exporter-1